MIMIEVKEGKLKPNHMTFTQSTTVRREHVTLTLLVELKYNEQFK